MLDDQPVGARPARPLPLAACPYIGLPDDPETRFSFADAAHRCRAKGAPVPIDLGHQGALCLTPAYPDCKRFAGSPLDAAARASAASTTVAAEDRWPTTPPIDVPLEPVAAEVAVLPDGAAKGDSGTDTGRSRTFKTGRGLVGVLILVGLVLIASGLGSGSIKGFLGAAATPTPTPTPPAAHRLADPDA